MPQVTPPRWMQKRFEVDSERAIDIFREIRGQEPLEDYNGFFDEYRDSVENLLEESVDLTQLAEVVDEYITDNDLRYALRYLSSPAISDDDLRVLAKTSFSKAALDRDEEAAGRVVTTILSGLDRWRFPWYSENRPPTDAERYLAIISTTSLIANRRAETLRRHEAKEQQEKAVADHLIAYGFKQVPTRTVSTVSDAPLPGEFCRESLVGDRKADLVIGLGDGRFMPCECKVSNSSTNSVKRLNNDAAQKAVRWRQDFGELGVVPAAVLSGVFKVKNLETAQKHGLTIFWSHSLDELTSFVDQTRGIEAGR